MKKTKLLSVLGAVAAATTVVAPVMILSNCSPTPEVINGWTRISDKIGTFDRNSYTINLDFQYKEAITETLLEQLDVDWDYSDESDIQESCFSSADWEVDTSDQTLLHIKFVVKSYMRSLMAMNGDKAMFNLNIYLGEEQSTFEGFSYSYVEQKKMSLAKDSYEAFQSNQTLEIDFVLDNPIEAALQSKLTISAFEFFYTMSPKPPVTPQTQSKTITWTDTTHAKAVITFKTTAPLTTKGSAIIGICFQYKPASDLEWEQTYKRIPVEVK